MDEVGYMKLFEDKIKEALEESFFISNGITSLTMLKIKEDKVEYRQSLSKTGQYHYPSVPFWSFWSYIYEGIVKKVDKNIFIALADNSTNVLSLALGSKGIRWNEPDRDIADDIREAARLV